MNILVTGGAGYIGSHVCVTLLENGHSVIVLDNLSNSTKNVLDKIKSLSKKDIVFYPIDATDIKRVEEVFNNHSIDGVIHLAGLKSVGESTQRPLTYYYNNIVSTLVIAKVCHKFSVEKIVFSSSATVYGNNSVPFVENAEHLSTTNPYGESKLMSEKILTDFAMVNPSFSVSILRYFNPIGAHPSGIIGEKPFGIPNNLMPFITQVAKGQLDKLKIFGKDYPTMDGTGIRDYIHVMDLAEGHLEALGDPSNGVQIYNLGTGKGTSVLELVRAFEETNQIKIPYEFVERRPGDLAECFAEVTKAETELGWKAKRDIFTMCRDAWRFEQNYKE